MKNGKVLLQVLLCFVLVLSLTLPTAVAGASSATGQVTDEHVVVDLEMDSSSPDSTIYVPEDYAATRAAVEAATRGDPTIVRDGSIWEFTTQDLCQDEPSPEAGFDSIADELVIAYHYAGLGVWEVYWAEFDIDTIEALEAGKIYIIYVESDCVLEYGTERYELNGPDWNFVYWHGCMEEEELILRPSTVVADEETEGVLTSVSEDQDVLTFAASTPLLDGVGPGDVIVIGATDHTRYGLLRKVTGITYDGEEVIVETEFATMEDAIEEGTIVVSATITAADVQAASLGVQGVTVLERAQGIGFAIPLDRTIGDFTFGGELTFNADPLINVEVTYWPPGLKELEFTIETDESLDVEVKGEVEVVDFYERIQLLPHPIEKHIVILVSGFPVHVYIQFTPVLIVEANLSGQVQARVEYEAQRKAGLHYKDGNWSLIKEQDSNSNGQAELGVQADLKASVGPEVVVKFYNIAGPEGNMFGYLEFESGWESFLWWELYGGLRAELGIKAELPILGEIGYGPVEVMHYRWLLAQYGEATELHLTITSTEGGSVTTPGEGTFTYDAGTVVNLVATPASGYRFVNWTGDIGTIANVNAASTTITMNGNYSITANFEPIPPGQYNLTVSSTAGGSVTTPGEGTFTRDAGTVVSLVATPSSGYHFDRWTGDVGTVANVNAASTTITMNGNYSITANFEESLADQYSLTISSTAGGSVTTPGEGTYTYDAGTVVSLVASPASGYQFVDWTGDVSTIANVNAASTTITMNGNYSITANFEESLADQYSLTISSTAGGSVTTPGEGTFTYDAGTAVDLVAVADSGHQFVNWTGDVGTIADVNAATTTITMHGNYAITANFETWTPDPLGEALDNTALIWTTGGDDDWFPETVTHYYGGDAAESGLINHNESTWLRTTVTGPGTLSFYWKVSCQGGYYDYLGFYIDGIEQAKITGLADWAQNVYPIGTGTYTLEWRYTKDVSGSSLSDRGWVDKVEWTP